MSAEATTAPDARAQADAHGGWWGEHPEHALADWRYLVENGDTRLGYWDWVANQEDGDVPSDAAFALAERHGGLWSEHPALAPSDWRRAAAADDTRLGYWDMVLIRIDEEVS